MYDSDYIAETAEIVKVTGRGEPIKLVWTREDDIKGGYYRPIYVHKVRVGLDKDGAIVGWHHRIVGQSIATGTPFESAIVKDGIDGTSVEGFRRHALRGAQHARRAAQHDGRGRGRCGGGRSGTRTRPMSWRR